MDAFDTVLLREDERIDDLERSGLGIIQKQSGFRFGMDAVLLSGFATVRKGETAVDLGTGTGIIPILLSAKTQGRFFWGIEIQHGMAEMAARSIALNHLEQRVGIIEGDLKERGPLQPGSIDVVTSNPPYMKAEHGLTNPGEMLAISRHEICCTLRDVCETASRLLRSGGRFYMVHRPRRLPELMEELVRCQLEPKRVKFVYPFVDKEANMVLIEAVRNGGRECIVEKPLIVYREPGVYTDEIYDIYGY